MKYFLLLFSMLLLGCTKKDSEPEVDYVNIEMFPPLGGLPSNIRVDLKNNIITFSNLQHIGTYDENCEEVMNKIQRPVEFVYINLTEEEIKIVNSNFNNEFYKSLKNTNQKLLDNPKLYDFIRFDGVSFEIDIVKEQQIFSTDNYLILEREDEEKIYKILKIIKKHSNVKVNKKYIDNISFYLTDFPEPSNYKQKFP